MNKMDLYKKLINKVNYKKRNKFKIKTKRVIIKKDKKR